MSAPTERGLTSAAERPTMGMTRDVHEGKESVNMLDLGGGAWNCGILAAWFGYLVKVGLDCIAWESGVRVGMLVELFGGSSAGSGSEAAGASPQKCRGSFSCT